MIHAVQDHQQTSFCRGTKVPFAGNRPQKKIFSHIKKGLHLELAGFSYLLAVLICAIPFILLMLNASASGEKLQNQVQPYFSHQPVHFSDNLRNEWGIILTEGQYSRNIHSQIGSVEMFSKTEDSNENDMEMPSKTPNTIKIFMCGDVMTGRGIDQVLPNQCTDCHEVQCLGTALGRTGCNRGSGIRRSSQSGVTAPAIPPDLGGSLLRDRRSPRPLSGR